MKTLNLILCLSILFLVSGCTPGKIHPKSIDQISRIGCISTLGDEIELKEVSVTVLDNGLKYISVPEWHIDKHSVDVVSNELKKTNYTYIDVNDPSQDFGKRVNEATSGLPDHKIKMKLIANDLKKISDTYNIDTLVIISKSKFKIPHTNRTNHMVSGYSLFHRTLLKIVNETYIYVAANVSIIDLRTMKVLASNSFFPREQVDESYLGEDFNALPDEKKEYIRTLIIKEIDSEVPSALKTMGLIN